MQRSFAVKNLSGTELGVFKASLTKKYGFEYYWISGQEPSWQDVVLAMTYFFSRTRLTEGEKKKVLNKEYVACRNNDVDIRFSPVIIDKVRGNRLNLPVTIEDQAILDQKLSIPFGVALKTVLALSMRIGAKQFLRCDHRKVINMKLSKFDDTYIEINRAC